MYEPERKNILISKTSHDELREIGFIEQRNYKEIVEELIHERYQKLKKSK